MLDYRDEIVKKLRWSLNGSNHLDSKEDKDEYFNLLYSEPGSKYITGILSPSLNTNEDESSLDDNPFSKTGTSDSSFGFTFALPKELEDNFIFGADFSTYKSIQVDGKERFKRHPSSKEFSVNQATLAAKNKIEHQLIVLKSKNGDAEIKLILTKRIDIQDVDRIIYTLSIVHFGKEESGMRKWRDTLFQVRVWVRYSNGFVELPYKSLDLTENSQQSSLLYRNLHRYSIGHGCGTNYQGDVPTEIESTFFPSVEVPVYKHKSIDSDSLSMLHWAEGNTDFELLNTIPSDYGDWLNEQMTKMNELSSSQILTLNQNKINVELAKSRIEEGIELIQSSKELQQAFKWMNLAMLTQQIRTKLPTVAVVEKNGVFTEGDSLEFDVFDKNTWPVDKNIYGKWRLFQMAFILMCISDIDTPSKNQSMDLIWFPTGGGKTEAYLGLSAFTLLVERLKGVDSIIGVKIIMRYTLRLLTAQQFERAAAMIVALDDIRKENLSLGTHPISIGLWVGGSVTFNSHGQPVTGYNKNPNTSNQWYANTNFDYANRPWPWILQKCLDVIESLVCLVLPKK